MNEKTHSFIIEFEKIRIKIDYDPDPYKVKKFTGQALDRFTIQTIDKTNQPIKQPNPLTPSGYLCHFRHRQFVKEYKNPESYIKAYVEHEGQKPQWLHNGQQLKLF